MWRKLLWSLRGRELVVQVVDREACYALVTFRGTLRRAKTKRSGYTLVGRNMAIAFQVEDVVALEIHGPVLALELSKEWASENLGMYGHA